MRRLMMLSSMVFLSLVLSVIPARGADSFTFITIDVLGAISTFPAGISNAGLGLSQIVGWYYDATDGTTHGFLGNLGDDGRFRSMAIDYTFPNGTKALATAANGINDHGQIVGWYDDATDNTHGFLYAAGSFSPIDYTDKNGTKATWTEADGINNAGQIVGWYMDKTYKTHGFLLAKGRYTPIDYTFPNGAKALATEAHGINNLGQIVGNYTTKDTITNTYKDHGFLLANGRYTSFDYPVAANHSIGFYLDAGARGINNVGQIVGYDYDDHDQGLPHGFLLAQGRINYPGAAYTSATGINNPNPKTKIAIGIGLYSIVGYYLGRDHEYHGFVATSSIPVICCLQGF